MGEVIVGPWSTVNAPTLDVRSFARYRRVTTRTVRRWVREGMPVDRDAHGNPRFNVVTCDAWTYERKVG